MRDSTRLPEATPQAQDSLFFRRQGRPYRTTIAQILGLVPSGGSEGGATLELDGGTAADGSDGSIEIDAGGA